MKMAIKVGFVGAGGRARGHMKALSEIEDVTFGAICDVNEATAQEAADQFGGNVYTDHKQMLDAEELAAMYVVVPTFAHFDAETMAAERGIHLFLEKPVAPSMEKAKEILAATKEADVITCVGYQLRYFPAVQQARSFVGNRTVGMVVSHRWGGLPGTPWWRVMAQSGGQLVEQTTHQIDMIRYVAGEITEVQAYYALRTLGDVENLDIPDNYAVTFKMENGAIGSLSSSCALREGGGSSGIDFILDDARLNLTGANVAVSPEADLGDAPEAGDIDQVFIGAVRTGDRSAILSDLEDGIRSLDVSLAANRSAESGAPVKTEYGRD
jgi:myo-inositol 2-dehydrogenase / D-chiro-inositol 1-dehydrogenase